MAKTKTKSKAKSSSGKDMLHGTNAPLIRSTPKKAESQKSIEDLLTEAATLLERSQPDLALPLAEEALRRLEAERQQEQTIEHLLQLAADNKPTYPQALVLSADIHLALGESDGAREHFLESTRIDQDGAIISAEPWLWLSQLCEQGGTESIHYFEKACEVLRNQIDVLEDAESLGGERNQQILDERRLKLAEALCGMTEVYMTDLSWELDAEARSEQLVTEAVAVCPERLSAGVLQTLASVRISQERIDEARKALATSMTIWKDSPIEVDDPAKPDFATRVSLTRLLMEVEAEQDALFVSEGLIKEDDQSVECSYLGGWCHVLLSQKQSISPDDKTKHEEQARMWLGNCLRLYNAQQYEDDRLQEHAKELISQLNKSLGLQDSEDDWEDDDDDDDIDDNDDDDDIDDNDDVELGLDDNDDDHVNGDVEMT